MGAVQSARLTRKQAKFAEALANGYSGGEAARRAGYSGANVYGEAHRLIRHPAVAERVQELRRAQIKGEMAHMALSTMRELMQDKDGTPAATRYKAAEWTLKAAGLAGADHADERRDKPMEEMTGDELAQAISSGMEALREIAGALDGQHVVDGERRTVQTIEADTASDPVEDESAEFLQ